MAFLRPSPPAVTQANTWWCWAACLEILNRAHPNKFPSPIRDQNQWMQEMQNAPAANQILNAHGGLNVHYLPAVLNALGMTGHQWAGPPSNRPDINFIEEKLRISYLLAIYQVTGGSHFVVISGVDANRVLFFNPWNNIGNTSVTHAQVRSAPLIIAWKQ